MATSHLEERLFAALPKAQDNLLSNLVVVLKTPLFNSAKQGLKKIGAEVKDRSTFEPTMELDSWEQGLARTTLIVR